MTGYVARARDAPETAQLLLEAGRDAGAANRTYYAAFYAAQAVIAHAAGINPRTIKTHHGLRRLFELHVTKAGLIDHEIATQFNNIASMRIIADYGDEPLHRDEVEAALRRAEAFVSACENLVRSQKA